MLMDAMHMVCGIPGTRIVIGEMDFIFLQTPSVVPTTQSSTNVPGSCVSISSP